MIEPLRLLAEIHGHLGWLAAAALVHPALLLRTPERWLGRGQGVPEKLRHSLSMVLASGLLTAAVLVGALVYGPFRERVRPALFQTAPSLGWLFERKEHLAVGAAAFAWIGVFSAIAARRTPEEERRFVLGRVSHRAFAMAAALAIVVATIGTVVASVQSF